MKKINNLSPAITKPEKLVDFYAALKAVSLGKRVTKLDWDNPNIYMLMNEEHLRIMLEDGYHDLIVSSADMDGKDWTVL
jgi:hypothetical protein